MEGILSTPPADAGAGTVTPPATTGTPDGAGAPPAFTPPEWAKGLTVGEEILKAPMFSNVKDMNDVVKGYYHAQKMVGADKVVVPTKASTQEEWRAFYQKGGLPATLDDYKPELPKTLDDPEFNKALINKAYELHVRPDQLAAIAQEMEAYNEGLISKYEADQKAEVINTVNTLKKEWGGDYDRNITVVNKVIEHFGGKEFHQAVLNSPLKNDGNFIRLMANIGAKLVKEDTFQQDVVQHFGTSKEEAQKEINKIYGDKNNPYFDSTHAQHKDVLARMLRLQEIVAEKA